LLLSISDRLTDTLAETPAYCIAVDLLEALLAFLVHTLSKRRGRRLVEKAE
jgi:hypothetical protein